MGCGQAKEKSATGAGNAEAPAGAKNSSGGKAATESGKKTDAKIQYDDDTKERIVLKKFRMNDSNKESIMGEGSFSICRKGTDSETKAQVAIKVYKENTKSGSKNDEVMMVKFTRQIDVLKGLQEKFVAPSDPSLWHPTLAQAKPSSLFMVLLDYSKKTDESPGPDVSDGVLYVITELAQYSLKDYLALRREQARPLPADSVKSISRAVILVVAGLHAKGLVHLDLKPENLMMFSGRLKLIDVDGCVKIGSVVSIQDSSISFSPCYCAPEWAQFLINESNSKITVSPALDVWSVGMTICELVTLNALLKPMYGNFLRNAHSHREAGFLFMDWLSNIKKVPLPKNVEKYDAKFVSLLTDYLFVCDKTKRFSCAQSLEHEYIKSAGKQQNDKPMEDAEKVVHAARNRPQEVNTNAKPLYKGTLWKLNSKADPKDPAVWLKRDMWIGQTGALCYFSTKENKRLVLLDQHIMSSADIVKHAGGAKQNAFAIKYTADNEKEGQEMVFAADSADEQKLWMQKLKNSKIDMPTMNLGNHVMEMRKFVVTVKNKRAKIDDDAKEQFAPIYKGMLWKLKAEGDRMKEEDWFEREMWVAKNGSLVYYSKKEERDLVYYTSADLARATYRNVPNDQSIKPNTFQIVLPSSDDVEFAPGDFAAQSEDLRKKWIDEFKKFGGGKQ